jgi:hypothetical protein
MASLFVATSMDVSPNLLTLLSALYELGKVVKDSLLRVGRPVRRVLRPAAAAGEDSYRSCCA